MTLRQLGIAKALEERGTAVLDPVAPSYGLAEFKEEMIMPTLLKATLGSDVFISGTNALTEDGKLVNIDGLGNRVAGIMFGARTSIVVIGRNKLVKNVDEALHRIKNTITPAMTRRREIPVPCAKAGKCVDCSTAGERMQYHGDHGEETASHGREGHRGRRRPRARDGTLRGRRSGSTQYGRSTNSSTGRTYRPGRPTRRSRKKG